MAVRSADYTQGQAQAAAAQKPAQPDAAPAHTSNHLGARLPAIPHSKRPHIAQIHTNCIRRKGNIHMGAVPGKTVAGVKSPGPLVFPQDEHKAAGIHALHTAQDFPHQQGAVSLPLLIRVGVEGDNLPPALLALSPTLGRLLYSNSTGPDSFMSSGMWIEVSDGW